MHAHAHAHAHTHTRTILMSLLIEIDDDFSNMVQMMTNDARCSVVVEHLTPGQTSTTGVEVGVPLSLEYDEGGRVV